MTSEPLSAAKKTKARRPFAFGAAALSIALLTLACNQAPERSAERKAGTQPPAGKLQIQAPPVPIPGGSQLPDGGPLIHAHAPGPDGSKLPISGFEFTGLNADPSTIGNFNGFSAMAALVGEVTGSDNKSYPMESDIRVFKGAYRAADGTERNGVFAFI